ncbi:ABC transporter ATP-binding protein [Bosea sp. SSUT16]|jgi:putative spermidine/putrescine transport system ATP-binding protein|uniref:Spermidine/putrescine import ATP-binding protein PotA n=1 Tax=Bosea spartocytisi TaxID=2773451 RepID=A0A927EB03_9HYPH|nr:ABC transporter ATP-binding protein [Bosea spartocytisi]MBD3847577.1 ABC transporter ATP-binding protein [Bosea spartocytisi]MCT4474387.1 ABC transporter ATP-binding protein [Bosea spartocytisi]
MSQISLQNVTKRYGNLTTVDRVSLDIGQGEFVAFLGPSGCGKTTTLRMIAGLTLASEGSIRFGTRDVTDLPPYLRNAGLVFQGYALFPHMTVAQNVAFGLEMRGVDRTQAQRRVQEALALVKLDHFADRLPKQLSGGQQQRVALARAIVYEPEVLLLDEPLSALDAKLRHEVRTDLRRLQSRLGLTTIFVTHDQDEAIAVADRVVVMSAGKVEQVGTPREIYQRPANRFVAEFIGLTNIFAGSIEAGGNFLTEGGERFAVSSERGAAGVTAFAVRPEQISLHNGLGSSAAPGLGALLATVEDVIYRGSLTEVVVRTSSGMPIVVHRQNAELPSENELRPGQPVVASWPAGAAMLF